MNIVRWMMKDRFKAFGRPVRITYGSVTKRNRLTMKIGKTHANDAYCIGRFFPKHRCPETHVAKRRRNERCLEKFNDAQYIDSRDGTQKSGKDLSCGWTKRSEPRQGDADLRMFRREKVSPGHRSVRQKRYDIRPGEQVLYKNRRYVVHGNQNHGSTLSLVTYRTYRIMDLQPKLDQNGVVKPLETGRKYASKGKKETHKLVTLNEQAGTAVMEWYFGVRPGDVTRIAPQYGGWIRVR